MVTLSTDAFHRFATLFCTESRTSDYRSILGFQKSFLNVGHQGIVLSLCAGELFAPLR